MTEAAGLTLPRWIPILSCVKAVDAFRGALTLALMLACVPPAAPAQIGTAGGLLPAPPSVGTIVPSGPAIFGPYSVVPSGPAIFGNPLANVPHVTSPPISFPNQFPVTSGFVGNVNTFNPFLPIQPIAAPITTFGSVYPNGYTIYDDGYGHRTYIPRGNQNPQSTPRPQPAAPAPAAPAAPAPAEIPGPTPEQRRALTAPPQNPGELEPDPNIEGILRQEVEDQPDLRASIVLYDLLGRRKAEYHSPGDFYPSSVMRLAVLAGVGREIARGQLDPNRRIELAPPPDNGTLTRRMGDYVSIAELMARMMRRGDLVATNILIDQVGLPLVNEAVSELDLRDTVLGRKFNDPSASASAPANSMPSIDAATLCYKLLRRDLPERGMGARMLDLMARQTATAGIPRLLRDRPGVQVWDVTASARLKSGREVANDVAIVTGSGHAYVLAVYTDAAVDHGAWIGELALRLHDALSNIRAVSYASGAD